MQTTQNKVCPSSVNEMKRSSLQVASYMRLKVCDYVYVTLNFTFIKNPFYHTFIRRLGGRFSFQQKNCIMKSVLRIKNNTWSAGRYFYSSVYQRECSKLHNHKLFLEGVDAFIFDCDGVIW